MMKFTDKEFADLDAKLNRKNVLTIEQATAIIGRVVNDLTDPIIEKGSSGGEVLTLLGTVLGAVMATVIVAEAGTDGIGNPDTTLLFNALAKHGKDVADDMLQGFALHEATPAGGVN